NPLLLGLSLLVWTVWIGVTAIRIVAQQPEAQTAAPAAAATPPQAPAAAPQGPAASLPAGYAGTDACVLCHEPQEKSITHSRHGQSKDRRSPAATLGCESCHDPGQEHID